MDLRTYLFKYRIQQKQFAYLAKCQRQMIWAIVSKRAWPGKALAKRIELATDGKVTVEEILKDKPCKTHVCPACGQRRKKKAKLKQMEMV